MNYLLIVIAEKLSVPITDIFNRTELIRNLCKIAKAAIVSPAIFKCGEPMSFRH